jgi:hypothetical protein
MSEQQGLRVASVDLGYPPPREDMTLNPDRSGSVDLTKLYDVRPVVITGSIVPSPAGSRSASWRLLAPFLNPAARPVLTYQIDGDQIVKTMTVRPSQMAAVADNPATSVFQVGFKAADPLAYDQVVKTAYCSGGVGIGAGRAYPLVYAPAVPGPEQDRVYPTGGSSAVNTVNNGDQVVYPLLRVYGPGSAFIINFSPAGGTTGMVRFVPAYLVNAGHYVQIDCKARTAYLDGDPTQNVYGQIQSISAWPYIPAGAPNNFTTWTLGASGTSTATQLQISWSDAYLL